MTDQGQTPPQTGGTRPGAMTMAMQAVNLKTSGPKVLRIGINQNGKIVQDRVIARRETVSVGSSERNHFILPAEGLPSRFELFQLVGGDYILNFTDKMTGRVRLPGGVSQLEQLRASGGARNAGSHWQVKLGDTSQGKIDIGSTTLLFQLVPPPPPVTRPKLPAAVQGGFVKSIDWPFTAFVVASFMLFFGMFIYLEQRDPLIDEGLDVLPPEVAALVFDEPVPPEPPEEQTTEATEETAQAPEERPQRQEHAEREERPAADPAAEAEARARLVADARAQAEAAVLGALGGDDGQGLFADVLRGGMVSGNAADIMAQATGVGVASRSGAGNLRERTGGDGLGQGGDLGSLRSSGNAGQAQTEGGAVQERQVRGRVAVSGGGDIGGAGEFDASLVRSAINSRRGAIQRCYENELRNNPSLSGKVTVQFAIETSGTVSGVSASENTSGSAALASCVTAAVGRMRFNPGPEGGSVRFSYPFVFQPQN